MEQLKLKSLRKGTKWQASMQGLENAGRREPASGKRLRDIRRRFDKGTYYQVPNVVSMNKGSGDFGLSYYPQN